MYCLIKVASFNWIKAFYFLFNEKRNLVDRKEEEKQSAHKDLFFLFRALVSN